MTIDYFREFHISFIERTENYPFNKNTLVIKEEEADYHISKLNSDSLLEYIKISDNKLKSWITKSFNLVIAK